MSLTVMKQNNHHYFGETNPVSIVSDVMGWRLDLIKKNKSSHHSVRCYGMEAEHSTSAHGA